MASAMTGAIPTEITAAADDGRLKYALHPVVHEFADFTADEIERLESDIGANGQCQPVAIWRNQIVDGRHRAMVCDKLGIAIKVVDITDECPTEEAMHARVRSLNQHRRSRTIPLTNEEKRMRIQDELATDPNRSDRAIAEAVGINHETVAAHRDRPEHVADSATCSNHRIGRNGYGNKREIVEAALKADPTRSNKEIATIADVSDRYVHRIRSEGRPKDNVVKRASTVPPVSAAVSRFVSSNGEREAAGPVAAMTIPGRPKTARGNPIVRAWDKASTGERTQAIGHLRKIGAVR